MVTSPYEWKILEWDVKPKRKNKVIWNAVTWISYIPLVFASFRMWVENTMYCIDPLRFSLFLTCVILSALLSELGGQYQSALSILDRMPISCFKVVWENRLNFSQQSQMHGSGTDDNYHHLLSHHPTQAVYKTKKNQWRPIYVMGPKIRLLLTINTH